MNGKFLHIVKIPSQHTIDNFSGVANYYNSTGLVETLSSLINYRFGMDQMQGKKILLKPNWVKHSTTPEDEFCLRTHDNFIIAALHAILKMNPSEVLIGDAPIQGCKWDKMITKSFIEEVIGLSLEYKIPVQLKDFRRRIYDVYKNSPESVIRPLSDYVTFDLGRESLLETITEPGKTKFRVTNYDPDRMSSAHAPGLHIYCITKEFFEADFVISLPKIKTHQKTVITGALKNLVGINGDKDFLPHHRIGGTRLGGDCYPGGSYLRYWSELAQDKANRRQGKTSFWFWQKLSSFLWIISFPGSEHHIAAGWHGNDTTWRMVLDINKIAEYGNADGTLSDNPQRQIFSLCDGIIAGQGDGPLNPQPLSLGIISFTNYSVLNDTAMALLMNLPINKIPLLVQDSCDRERYCEITFNGEKIHLGDLKRYSKKAVPPKGWIGYFNKIK
jgi:uncharacterized protein (DUF362 family)